MSQSDLAWNNVRGLERLSLCDWPGRSSCVLFLGGCNLRCPTCHNANLAFRPEGQPVIAREAIMSYLTRRRLWLDGVTITGGEPTTSPDLPLLLRDVASIGLPIKMDSNGMRPDVIASLLDMGLVDTFAVDVKGPFEKYPALTGNAVSATHAKQNIESVFGLAESHPNSFYFRTTKVPLLTDEDLRTVHGLLPAGFELTEQEYVAPGRTANAQTDSETRRLPGDVVSGSYRQRDSQGAQSERHQGSPALQAAGA